MLRAMDGAETTPVLLPGDDGRARCWWSLSAPEYVAYHDREWGRPVLDDDGIYERLCLEGFQSGLSWLTILRKREAFRAAFAGFRIEAVAAFGVDDVQRLLGDAGIVRNRQKIEAAIGNARAALAVIEARGSLASLFWEFRPERRGPAPRSLADLAARDAGVARPGARAQTSRLSLRRPDDRLRSHAGDRHRRRPPRGLLRARGGRARAAGRGGSARLSARYAAQPSPAAEGSPAGRPPTPGSRTRRP